MPSVYNRREDAVPVDAVYVGRPSRFGNPFAIGRHGSRIEVIAQFREYLASRPELIEDAKRTLRGKDLVCWCAPEACHADVLMEVANELSNPDHGVTELDGPAEDRF